MFNSLDTHRRVTCNYDTINIILLSLVRSMQICWESCSLIYVNAKEGKEKPLLILQVFEHSRSSPIDLKAVFRYLSCTSFFTRGVGVWSGCLHAPWNVSREPATPGTVEDWATDRHTLHTATFMFRPVNYILLLSFSKIVTHSHKWGTSPPFASLEKVHP